MTAKMCDDCGRHEARYDVRDDKVVSGSVFCYICARSRTSG
jgi:hypothetical protein